VAVLVVGAVTALGLVVAWEVRYVGLWALVRLLDAAEGVDVPERRYYADFRQVVTDRGVAALDLAWGPGPEDRPRLTDRADWQLHTTC
jgi:hypothetical protein